MAVTQLKDGRWICYYKDAVTKKQVREYFGRGLNAESSARQRNNELSRKPGGRPAKKQYGPIFAELAAGYYREKRFDAKPRETLTYRLEKNILPAIGHRRAIMLNHGHLDAYVRGRRSDGVKDNSISREITDIKAILSWSVNHRPPLIPINPVRDYRPPSSADHVFLPPEPHEVDAIYHHAAGHLKRFVLLAAYLGLRPGATELLSLSWPAVSWSRRTINIMSANKGGPPHRSVPIHDGLFEPLLKWHAADVKKYPEKHDQIRIVHYYGRPVQSIKRAWRSALDRAGIARRIRPYDLRHRFVTLALENGADIGALAGIVGSRPETLRRHYQHVTADMHRRTINSIPNLVIKVNDQ